MKQKQNKLRVYLSGPMTGLKDHNYPAFYEYAEFLRNKGYAVMSPAEMAGRAADMTWADYVRQDLRLLLECDAIAMIPGWQKSNGARVELIVALVLGFKILDASTGKLFKHTSVEAAVGMLLGGLQ